MPYVCDLHSVGVLLPRSPDGDRTEYLVFTRVGLPSGVAPPAGHVFDEHPDPEGAARAEVHEETGLTITAMRQVALGWRPNRCGALLPDGTDTAGHFWWIYEAQTHGALRLAPDEARDARWVTPAGLHALAERTAAYAAGHIPEDDWQRAPGLEPVWCSWLDYLDVITLPAADLHRIVAVAATVPT